MFRSSISIFGIRTPRPEHDVESAAPAETAPPVRTFSTFPVESAPPVPTLPVENTPQQSQSRFGRFSINARTIVGSSVYSQSPGQPRWKTPKMPAMPWGRRPVSADLDTVENHASRVAIDVLSRAGDQSDLQPAPGGRAPTCSSRPLPHTRADVHSHTRTDLRPSPG